ncbi:MAG: ParB/RepB/Spo0J family partition protein, partial [Desulfobulbus sp.]|nr:ParB/RepB/Spo0J family partition protein [Desulfobulbus sp.]
MTKSVLGRGVGALLPEDIQEEADRFFMCDIDKISANPNQPRSHFDMEKLQQLADSIQEKGIIQPLLVSHKGGNRYVLIAGERRLRAAKMLGHLEVPVVVMEEGNDRESLELALIENIQRHDLNPIEEAFAYTRLMEEFNLTQEEVARKVGRQRSTITNVLRLLQLPETVRNDVISGTISEGHARVLLRMKDHPDRL